MWQHVNLEVHNSFRIAKYSEFSCTANSKREMQHPEKYLIVFPVFAVDANRFKFRVSLIWTRLGSISNYRLLYIEKL